MKNGSLVHYSIFQDTKDFECALLASLGFSDKLIISRTKLTPGQISYRLKRAGISRQNYRDGKSTLSKLVTNRVQESAKAEVERKIRKFIPHKV